MEQAHALAWTNGAMTTLDFAARPLQTTDRVTPLLAHWAGLCPDSLLILRLSGVAHEDVRARYGTVEIRQTQPGLSAQTRVKGQLDQALATAMQRFRKLLCRNDRSGVDLRLFRPLVMTEEAPDRWLVRIGLRGGDGIMSPASRGGRVRIIPMPAETLAVLRLLGSPKVGVVERGSRSILQSLADTQWIASGRSVVRLQAPPSALPFLGRFDVAVPVAVEAAALM
jgi:SOUL heme-binding protein